MTTKQFVVDKQYKRIDIMIADNLGVSRSNAQKLIEKELVTINGSIAAKPSLSANIGDTVVVGEQDNQQLNIVAQSIDIDIVYQDDDIVVINKRQGMTVHPAPGVYTDTLVNALLHHITDLSGINGVTRPGIVHRLDKNTSGLLVVAKNDNAHNSLASQIQDKSCHRIYWAIVEGVVKCDSGTIDVAIARSKADRKLMTVDNTGRKAITNYTVIERFNNNTLVEFRLNTGRTHQIRVHSKYMGHPVVGDAQYGFKHQRFNLNGQLLHAKQLSFVHPTTGEPVTFTAPLPDYFEKILAILRKEKRQ